MNRPDLDQILAELEKARVLASMKAMLLLWYQRQWQKLNY